MCPRPGKVPVAEGRAVPPVPPSQVGRPNRRTALPPQHRCCLFLLPTHPVYLKRPRDKIAHGMHEREDDPAPSPPGCTASFPARSLRSGVSCSVITNICSPPPHFPTGPRAAGEAQSAASPPGNATRCRPPPHRGPRAGTHARPGAQLPSGATLLALPGQLHQAGTSQVFQPPQSSGSKHAFGEHQLPGRSQISQHWPC